MNKIFIKVSYDFSIPLNAPRAFIKVLGARLTYPNPANPQYDIYLLKLYKRRGCYSAPRGSLHLIQAAADATFTNVEFISNVVGQNIECRDFDSLPVKLRDYQEEAVRLLINRVQGYIVLPCGGGKTFLGCAALKMANQPSLVLVHTIDLLKQWVESLKAVGFTRIRRIGGGEKSDLSVISNGEVVVSTIQTLSRLGTEADPVVKSACALIVDEVHHVAASNWRKVVTACPARFRWGLTATPERADGYTFMLPLIIGPQLFRMSAYDLIKGGYLCTPKLIPVDTEIQIKTDDIIDRNGQLKYADAVTRLSNSPKRIRMILDFAHRGALRNRKILILVGRVDLAQRLEHLLKERGVNSISITGSTSKKKREQSLNLVRNGSVPVMISTQLADEGLDVPILDLLILANPGKASGRSIQRIGRIMRLHDLKKKPVVVDFIDRGPFKKHWQNRCFAYIEHIGVHPSTPITFDEAKILLKECL